MECAKCGMAAYQGVVIKGKDHCLRCADEIQDKRDLALVDQYPHEKVRVHDALNYWRKTAPKSE